MARNKRNSTPTQEKIATRIYKCFSDFGMSIVRPVGALFAIWAYFSIVYFVFAIYCYQCGSIVSLGSNGNFLFDAYVEAMNFSASRIFPFGAFDGVTREFIEGAEKSFGHGIVFLLRAIATIQSIISLVAVFLFGLAVRRRFQLN